MKKFDDAFQLQLLISGENPIGYVEVYGEQNWSDVEVGIIYQGRRVLPFIQIEANTANDDYVSGFFLPIDYGKFAARLRERATCSSEYVEVPVGSEGVYLHKEKEGVRDFGFYDSSGKRLNDSYKLILFRPKIYQRFLYLLAKYRQKR